MFKLLSKYITLTKFILLTFIFTYLIIPPTYSTTLNQGVSKAIKAENKVKKIEIYRIYLKNVKDGEIKVSANKGKNWQIIGKVLAPTTKVNPLGYTASLWAKTGTVAATAVNAIHIKTGVNTKDNKGIIFSLLPKEFFNPLANYKSYLSPDSSIYTDIPASAGIFGGGFAPFIGSEVFIIKNKKLVPISEGFVPQENDELIIIVKRPKKYPLEIIFENRFGGFITVVYSDNEKKIIGEVLKPVQGVGRFEGSIFLPPGRIRANHCGVIDISTSPLGEIGGFQIIPANHGMSPEMGNARLLTQWMVIGPLKATDPSFEATAPLFFGFIKPDYNPNDLYQKNALERYLKRFLVKVKINNGDWQFMPIYVGRVDDALKDITAVKIIFPIYKSFLLKKKKGEK